MNCYRIKAWDAVFENNRSRQFEEPSYVNWPVRRDSEGFASLMRDAAGMAAFGLFGALVQWLGRQPAQCRRTGYLYDDKGAMTPQRFAARMAAPLADVAAAWERLVAIGWLTPCTADEVPVECRSGADVPPTTRRRGDTQVTPKCHPSDSEVTPKCYGTERTGVDRNGLERTGSENTPDNSAADDGGQESRKGIAGGHPFRPPAPSVQVVRDAATVRAALAALHIDGAALEGLASAESLTLDVLRDTVAEITAQPGVRNPKRLLVSVLCERHGVKIEKGAKHRIGPNVSGVVAKFEQVRRSKMGGGA
jgi:hypothetical protein